MAYLPEHRPTQLSENKTEKSTNDTSFKSQLGKTHSALSGSGTGHKRKHEEELGQVSITSRQQARKSVPAAASLNLDPKERLKLPGDDGLSKKQKVQFKESVPKTNVPLIESPERPAEELGVPEVEQKERHDPISYWAAHHTWPVNFARHNPMGFPNSTNQKQRTSDRFQSCKDVRSRSYSPSRKNGEVPVQYSSAYEVFILTKGLDMDIRKGENFVSEESRKTCTELLQIDAHIIEPTAVPQDKIRNVVLDCRTRNEAMVNRYITPLMIPSIRLSYYCGASHLEHVVDEVNTDWYVQCVLEGPRIRPDLAIGLSSSAFTEGETDKLKRCTSVDNWTQFTLQMFFPFLMCEVKCGREGLDVADRQNMHSSSVAVRALLRIEQEADTYRPTKKLNSLNGQVLVFSISHDQRIAHLNGHHAIMHGEKWNYYRYEIETFVLTRKNDLLAIHNFVRNVLKSYLPGHVRRLKEALAALPDLNKSPESSGLPGSSGLSFGASGISLIDDNSQQDSEDRHVDGIAVPSRPDSSQNGGAKKKGQVRWRDERTDKLMQQPEEEREHRKREEK
ncbi:MAG: hypothetical protein M1837_000323 [Sclerophora amabilis]|nr:MAG: hypothetical protein M1837_000323 [Sclerophora amabilis]